MERVPMETILFKEVQPQDVRSQEILSQFAGWLRNRGYTVESLGGMRQDTAKFLRYLDNTGKDIEEAGKETVEEYCRYMMEELEYAPATIMTRRNRAFFFLRWLGNIAGIETRYSRELEARLKEDVNARHMKELKAPLGETASTEFNRGYSEYLCQKEATKIPKRTLEGVRHHLRIFYEYLAGRGASEYSQVKTADVRDYPKHLTELSPRHTVALKASSVNRNLFDVKSHLKWLSKRGLCRSLSQYIRNLRLEHPVKNTLSRKDIVKLMNLRIENPYGFMMKTIMMVLYASGVRIGELLSLKLSDLDLENREAYILEPKRRVSSARDRIVQLGEVGTAYLRLFIDEVRPKLVRRASSRALSNASHGDNPYVFVKVRGDIASGGDEDSPAVGRLGHDQVDEYIKKFCALAGIQKHVSCHTFRHTYATHLLENGAKTKYVSDLLGHREIGTTERYLHLSPAHLRETLLKYHPMESK